MFNLEPIHTEKPFGDGEKEEILGPMILEVILFGTTIYQDKKLLEK